MTAEELLQTLIKKREEKLGEAEEIQRTIEIVNKITNDDDFSIKDGQMIYRWDAANVKSEPKLTDAKEMKSFNKSLFSGPQRWLKKPGKKK